AELGATGLNPEPLGCYENNLQVHMEHSFLVTAAVPEPGGLRIINAYHNHITWAQARPVRVIAPTLSSTARTSSTSGGCGQKRPPSALPAALPRMTSVATAPSCLTSTASG